MPATAGAPASTAWQPRRIAQWAAVCGLGLVLLYGLDGYRGWWLARQVAQVRAAEAASGGIEQRLAVNRYLEKNASPALPGLDAILSAAPPTLTLTSFSVAADGALRLAGSVGSPNEMQDFFRKLEESRVLTQVEVRSIRPDQQRWVVELTAKTAPGAGLMLTPAAKPSTSAPAWATTAPPAVVTRSSAAATRQATTKPADAPGAPGVSSTPGAPGVPGTSGTAKLVAPTSQPSAGGRP